MPQPIIPEPMTTEPTNPLRLTFLGPEGTFAHAALLTLPEAADAVLEPSPNVPAALDAVRRGDADAAVVPLENSAEGSVSTTLDEFANGEPLHIARELLLPVTFTLFARPGTALADITGVGSHPHAEAQCRRWLARTLPGARVLTAPSTADAARAVAAGEGPYDAAITSPLAGVRYGLVPLAENIGDRPDAVTRFVLAVRPGGALPEPTGADRSTIVAFIADDHPGALLEILTEFAVRGVNLTRIESRPTGSGLGRYCFSIDCEGHVAEARVGEALSALRRICADIRFCGSYARADRERPTLRYGVADDDFAVAADWLGRIRTGQEA